MGWCLDCHRTKHVNFDNKYYTNQFKQYHEEIKKGMKKGVTVAEIGGQDCARCHYQIRGLKVYWLNVVYFLDKLRSNFNLCVLMWFIWLNGLKV